MSSFRSESNGSITGNPGCSNVVRCSTPGGVSRFCGVLYATGNAYLGATDRGAAQPFATFLSEPVFFLSADQRGNIVFTSENSVTKQPAPGGKKISIKSWKENNRRP